MTAQQQVFGSGGRSSFCFSLHVDSSGDNSHTVNPACAIWPQTHTRTHRWIHALKHTKTFTLLYFTRPVRTMAVMNADMMANMTGARRRPCG